ncbi:hypothetical protein L249_8777 [Ophiocordyceps polyrhachis-furcata BCC 54312]|uniref:RING-type domain-containing protein n=1 Tax=Ophiocordyceps polyrhachis-furcata BCC 54312 TaxID=1330021 RepID=A0A367L1W2_9HYPO|nr:hypothetical protein L249_8777 [Ophiocordyceps polyrhachis-furcata BCC 54312]
MASSISEAHAELISSLSPDDIPIKLRCAICSKLAVNAFRLPCCEQAICETCMETKIRVAPETSDPNVSSPGQSSLPLSCPVCEHSPLAAEDCNPNKSLRTTIRVFLRTAEKKREANRAKESKEPVPAAPVEALKPSIPDAEPVVKGPPASQPVIRAAVAQQQQESDPASRFKDVGAVQEVTQAVEQPEASPENGPWKKQTDQTSAAYPVSAVNQEADGNNVQELVVHQNVQGAEEMANGQVGFGMDGGFPNNHHHNSNMMFPAGGDLNQVQMMMAMQNGMGTASFGGFPMMGMGMDPMTMYMNGGFQGMGMGGYGGGFGQGSNNNWNGAQSWSFDYNHGGDYGNMTAGFQTGYNQGSYGGHFNDYRRNNFGRGRGRGRGLYGGFGGRGGHYYQDNQDQGGFYPPPDARRLGDEGGQDMMGLKSAAATYATAAGGGETAEVAGGDSGGQLASSRENLGNEAASGDVLPRNSTAGAIRSVLSTPDVPINAPTGPKAMRQGLPNTSLHNLRARGYQVDEESRARSRSPEREAERRDQQGDGSACEKKRQPENGEPSSSTDKMPEPDRPSTPISPPPLPQPQPNKANRSRSRSPSHSRSRSRHRSPSRSRGGRHRRPLSPPTEGDGQSSSRRRKRTRGGRKHGTEHYTPSKEERRSRSVSVERTSGHRGHNKDKERRERRSHRDRSRDRGRDRDYEYDHPSRRERERRDRRDDDDDRHRRRHHHHHHHHQSHHHHHHHHNNHHRHDPTSPSPDRKANAGLPPPPPPSRRPSAATTTNATSDPHTVEREARNRERLLKEAQRIAGLAGSKRGRDVSDEGARRARRAVRRSDDDEERMRRLEAEREGGRWD